MHEIILLPKIDLHRHLTGSLTAAAAVRIAAKHDIELPTYIASDLDKLLFPQDRVSTHAEYFSPWPILNQLFQGLGPIEDIILSAVEAAAADNVIYVELRIGPRGFLGHDGYSFDEYLQTIAAAVVEAEGLYGVVVRCVLGIPRHVFIRIPDSTRERMFASIIHSISQLPNTFVGIDLNGDELAASVREFAPLFRMAHKAGISTTAHAGEVGDNPSDAEYAVNELKVSRVGHGIAAAASRSAMSALASAKCTLEICPTSNKFLGVVAEIRKLPLHMFRQAGIPYVICTDNPARCQTSLSEELFKVAEAFALSVPEIVALQRASLAAAFVPNVTKEMLTLRASSWG